MEPDINEWENESIQYYAQFDSMIVGIRVSQDIQSKWCQTSLSAVCSMSVERRV